MRLLSIILILFVLNGCGQDTVNFDELMEKDGKLALRDSGKLYSGHVYDLYENGKKRREGFFKKGIPHGLMTEWSSDGKKESESRFKNGEPHGSWIEFDQNGLIWKEKEYKDGKLINEWFWEGLSEAEIVESLHFIKSTDGTMYAHRGRSRHKLYSGEYSEMYEVGGDTIFMKEDGEFKEYQKQPSEAIDENQAKEQKKLYCHYKNGKLDGKLSSWYKNGTKHREATYNEGTLIEEKFWNIKGEPVQERLTREGVAIFNPPEGAVLGKKLASYTSNHPSLEGISLFKYNDKSHSGYVYEIHEGGNIALEGNLKNGKKIGKWIKWHLNGKKSIEANFEDGKYIEETLKKWSFEGHPLKVTNQSNLYANSFFLSHYSMD
jgi:antitoxin component YwqK of YwqJK toxin-antitoxin module